MPRRTQPLDSPTPDEKKCDRESAGLIGFEVVKEEIGEERNLKRWAKKSTHHFTKKVKRMLYYEIDNFVWSGQEMKISEWCQRNKVYDEITHDEIEEIWKRESQDDGEPVRLNRKYVWDTAKKVCDFINAHEDLIHITTFGEYRAVMRRVIRVIKEAHNAERKRRQTARKKKSDDTKSMAQRTKSLIADIKR